MNNPAKVVVFACNWDGLSCVEAAAQEDLCYPASVKVIRISCLSRLHLGLILKAFELKYSAAHQDTVVLFNGNELLGINAIWNHLNLRAGTVLQNQLLE